MSTRSLSAKVLAWALETHENAGSAGIPNVYDDEKPGYRSMTAHEIAIARRYMARAERQRDFLAAKIVAEDRRREREDREARQLMATQRLAAASAAMARIPRP